jgi:hypothetical protein
MRRATLTRTETSDEGTFGILLTDSGFSCRTGELPWRDNADDISCIPIGTYVCRWGKSPKYGECYHVENVPGRTDILFHAANFMGDRAQGLKSELRGCIAPGKLVGTMNGQKAIFSSRSTLISIEAEFGREPFELVVTDVFRALASTFDGKSGKDPSAS